MFYSSLQFSPPKSTTVPFYMTYCSLQFSCPKFTTVHCTVHGHVHCTVYSNFFKKIFLFLHAVSPKKSTTVHCTWPCTLYRVQPFILKISFLFKLAVFAPKIYHCALYMATYTVQCTAIFLKKYLFLFKLAVFTLKIYHCALYMAMYTVQCTAMYV